MPDEREVTIAIFTSKQVADDLEGLAVAAGHLQQPQEGQVEKADLTPLVEDAFRVHAWVLREQAHGRLVGSFARETTDFLQANRGRIPGFFMSRVPDLVPAAFHQRVRSFFMGGDAQGIPRP